jgi:hypothetical protein
MDTKVKFNSVKILKTYNYRCIKVQLSEFSWIHSKKIVPLLN